MSLDTPERCELLALARASIDATLSPGRSNSNLLPFTATSLPPALTVRRSSFEGSRTTQCSIR